MTIYLTENTGDYIIHHITKRIISYDIAIAPVRLSIKEIIRKNTFTNGFSKFGSV